MLTSKDFSSKPFLSSLECSRFDSNDSKGINPLKQRNLSKPNYTYIRLDKSTVKEVIAKLTYQNADIFLTISFGYLTSEKQILEAFEAFVESFPSGIIISGLCVNCAGIYNKHLHLVYEGRNIPYEFLKDKWLQICRKHGILYKKPWIEDVWDIKGLIEYLQKQTTYSVDIIGVVETKSISSSQEGKIERNNIYLHSIVSNDEKNLKPASKLLDDYG